MEKEIIKILGENHMEPISFNDKAYDDVHGLYTYENVVYILKDGEDIDFSEFTEEEQENILNLVKSNNWVVDPSLQ